MPIRKAKQTAKWFFLIIAAVTLFISWRIIEPYALTLVTAAVAAIVLAPVDRKLRPKVRNRHLSSIILVIGVFLCIVIPLFLSGLLMVQQANQILDSATGENGWARTIDIMENPIVQSLPEVVQNEIRGVNAPEIGRSIASWFAKELPGIFSGTAKAILHVFVFFIALYYLIMDREKIYDEALAISPFRDSLDRDILHRIASTVRGVVFGALIIAITQGVLASIGMTVFGVPGALIWGALTVVAAQLPLFGVGFVLIPAIIYLFVVKSVAAGVGLLIWSALVVGLVDNAMAPWLIKGKTHMHTLAILISILGGLELFGPVGFIVGPTVLAAMMAVLELYKSGILNK